VVVQRYLLFIVLVLALVIITISLLVIRYVKSTTTIEPFVIEIEQKTGVPTVVEPISSKAYSADIAVRRYFVMTYIRAREEYTYNLYDYYFSTVVRVMSTEDVYSYDYRKKFSISNPLSPRNVLGEKSYRKVNLKSIVFPKENSAQVRLSLEDYGQINAITDKIVYMEFDFRNVKMNDDERLINPLGFTVTNYRIEDERGGTQ
jgi:type IV secretion system protein VirB8